MARRRQPSEDEERMCDAKWHEFLEEAMHKPMEYVPHDTNTHLDDEMRDLVTSVGIEGLTDGLGMGYLYWCLMELLAQRPDHLYDVSTERGWRLVAIDLSTCGVPVTPDQCKELVLRLIECRKLSADSYSQFHHIASGRISRNVAAYAEKVAQKKLAGWKSGLARGKAT